MAILNVNVLYLLNIELTKMNPTSIRDENQDSSNVKRAVQFRKALVFFRLGFKRCQDSCYDKSVRFLNDFLKYI